MKRLLLMGILSIAWAVALPQHQESAATNGEDSVLTQDILLTTAVDEIMPGYHLTVTPSAENKMITVNLDAPQPGMVIEIYTNQDRRLLRQMGLSSTTLQVSVQYVPPGEYTMKVLTPGLEVIQTYRLQKTIPL